MEKEKLEEKTWKISKANKKYNGKRLKRQFGVCVFSITIIIILVLIGLCIYNKYECEFWNVPRIQEDEIFYDEMKDRIINESEKSTLDEYNSNEFEDVYTIINKDFELYSNTDSNDLDYQGIKLLEYDNSNKNYAEIYLILYDYRTEPSYYYTVKITDTDSKSILLDENNKNIEEKSIYGGVIEGIRIEKTKLNSTINITVVEKENNNTINESQIELDLSKDLSTKEEINGKNRVSANLIDVIFEYIDSENVYEETTQYAYSLNLVGEIFSVDIKAQYGNRLFSEEHIDFRADRNVNNLTLNQAFEDMSLICSTMGNYSLSDVYGFERTDSQGNVLETVTINFDEMKKLARGEKIVKNGQEYTAEMLTDVDGITYKKLGEEIIGDNINAIKYIIPENKDYVYYMFVYKDYIYEITCPTNERVKKDVQEFLDSIVLN